MPTLEDQREKQEPEQLPFNDGTSGGWNTHVSMPGYDWAAGEKDLASKDSNTYDQANPASKALDGDQLSKNEGLQGLTSGQSGAVLPKEENSSFYNAGKALGEARGAAGGKLGRFAGAKAVLQSRRGQAAGISGIFVTIIVIMLGLFAASTEMIHIKEGFTGKGSISQKYSVKYRRAKVYNRIIGNFLRQNPESLLNDLQKLNTKAVQSALAKGGFEVTTDTAGKVTKLEMNLADGTKLAVDYLADDVEAQVSNLMERGGKEALDALDKASKTAVGLYKGPYSRAFYSGKLSSSLKSWLRGAEPDPAKTPEENAKLAAAEAEKPAADIPEQKGIINPDSEVTETDANGKTTTKSSTTDPASIADEVGEAAGGDIDSVASTLDDIPVDATQQAVAKSLEGAAVKAGISGLKSGVVAAIDYSQWDQILCKANGTLQWIASVRNVLLTIELARFALRYLNAADSQKAGLLTSEAINLYLTYFRAGRQNGNYASTGGVRYATGDHSAVVPSSALGQFSTGRTHAGTLGVIANFINSLPGVNSDAFRSNCKLVNNGWFQAGSMVIGTVAAIFTLGGSAGVSFSAQSFLIAGAQAAIQLTLEFGGPLLVRTGEHKVMQNLLDTASKGNGLGAGLGALSSMNSSANSLLIANRQQSAALRTAALNDARLENRKLGAFARYLSPHNPDSLLNQIAFSVPRDWETATDGAIQNLAAAMNPITLVSTLQGKVYAAEPTDPGNEQCTDPRLQGYATDPFCNPEVSIAPDLDIQQTKDLLVANGQINEAGEPIGDEFKDFLKYCASGQPTLVYNTDVSKNGDSNVEIDNCISDATSLKGETVPASKAYAYIYESQPKPSFFARLFGAKAYAAPVDAGLVSQRLRFAAWQAFVVDVKTIVEDVNGDFSQTAVNTTPGGVSGGASPITAPGLNGYTIPCSGLPETAMTTGARSDAINWDAIPDSGTIGLASDGAPIKVYIREPCSSENTKTVIIASSIHGTENQGQGISFELLFKKNLPPNMRVIAIPEINHAGINADPGRINANEVNLNRNFAYNWAAIAKSSENNYSGPSAESEPETKAVKQFLNSVSGNNLLIAYHDNLGYIVASNQQGLLASKSYYDYVTLHGVTGFTNKGGQQNSAVVAQQGSLDAWYGSITQVPTMLIEMKQTSTATETSTHADAIINLVTGGVL